MRTVFHQVIVPSAQRFNPDIILVSAGSDFLSFFQNHIYILFHESNFFFSDMMHMYWIHLRISNSQQERITCWHRASNSLQKSCVEVDVCFSWKEDTTLSLFPILLQNLFVLLLEKKAWQHNLMSLASCMMNHLLK